MKGFRVWSDYWEKYATEAELYMDGSVDAIFEDDDGVSHHENTDLVVEFRTSLKDKNGKEICEGDIVKGSWLYGKNWQVVKYQKYGFYPFMVTDFDGDSMVQTGDITVIGNIHENPELLGDTNVTNKEEE